MVKNTGGVANMGGYIGEDEEKVLDKTVEISEEQIEELFANKSVSPCPGAH
ncbi:MAG: hypothetical protein ACRCXT_14900 [Paraclostridium sp.]